MDQIYNVLEQFPVQMVEYSHWVQLLFSANLKEGRGIVCGNFSIAFLYRYQHSCKFDSIDGERGAVASRVNSDGIIITSARGGCEDAAPKICCLLVASCMALPSVLCDQLPILYFGNMRALVLVDVCIMKHMPVADVSSKGSIWVQELEPFFCLFLHFTKAVSSTWAVILKVHVASGIVS